MVLSSASFKTPISLSRRTPQFVPSVLGKAVLCKESSTRSTPFLNQKHCQTNLGGNGMLTGNLEARDCLNQGPQLITS